jgi:hypothetical protein
VQPVERYDAATLGEVTRTPQGFLRAPARVTRTGVLTYRRADGTLRRELRRPEQVFAGGSLATLADAPITDLHPREMVSATNSRELALGHVTGDARADGKRYVEATLLITDAKLIAAVERRDRVEASCGYTCTLIEQPGTYQGERYDAEQTGIVYNHVGLGPRGWGRAGADVALRLDGKPAELIDNPHAATLALDPLEPPETAPPHKGHRMDLVTVRIDGIDAQVTPQAEQLVRKVTAQLETVTASSADLQKRLDAKTAELDATAKQLAAASDTKRLDSLVAERVALFDAARAVLGAGVELTGLSSRQIQEKAIAHLDSAATMTGQSDEYVAAYFTATTKQIKPAGGGKDPHRRADGFPPGTSAADVARAQLKSREPAGGSHTPAYEPPAWRQPLSVTRT